MLSYDQRVRLHRARSSIERRLNRLVFGPAPSWTRRPNEGPWVDRPDALERIRRGTAPGRRGRPDTQLLEKWVRDGYIVVDHCVDSVHIDAMVAALDGLWDASEAIPSLELIGLKDEGDEAAVTLSHADVLKLDPARRRRLRDTSDWRIHGFHYVNRAAMRIYSSPSLRALASGIFGRRARPIAAINFMKGSQQHLHQDMAVFHIYPHNFLLGAWIACEDISRESGPLVFYPGSHRAGLFPGFADYPQTNLRTADDDTARRYQAYVDALATQFERREFWARKGQVLLWHGMLIHGGAAVTRRDASRKSMVIHYSVRGADRAREVQGPFRW
jgi:ectoine hydroxylase-related dioxygenase (phytanoyl-CoA dioxygenase family)